MTRRSVSGGRAMVVINLKKKDGKKKHKRGATEVEQGAQQQAQAVAGADGDRKRRSAEGGAARAKDPEDGDGLIFEDPFEDEYEEEEIVDDEGDMMDVEDEGATAQEGGAAAMVEEDEEGQPVSRVFVPGVDSLAEGEELEHDPSAYVLYHCLTPEWPCLSFDIMTDPLGHNRTRFPVTMYAVCGTQADSASANKLTVMKMTELHKTQTKAHDSDDSSDDESDDEDEGLDVDPILDQQSVRHEGGVNRLRCMPQASHVVASWADSGAVHVWDLSQHVKFLDSPGSVKGGAGSLLTSRPLQSFKGHRDEGFALDWSHVSQGSLVTGDNTGVIHNWTSVEGGGWAVDAKAGFSGHSGSIEDLQWSPSEASVFMSASSDHCLRVWDLRQPKRQSMLSVTAHDQDVNVCSWNRNVAYLLASGSDDGCFKVWDLRKFQQQEPLARFQWHKGPITSIEWHPTDESILACASEDDQVSVWDLSVEADDDAAAPAVSSEALQQLPPQLLFVHQGQKEVKELHFHPQVPGLIMTTAMDGFNVFKPAI